MSVIRALSIILLTSSVVEACNTAFHKCDDTQHCVTHCTQVFSAGVASTNKSITVGDNLGRSSSRSCGQNKVCCDKDHAVLEYCAEIAKLKVSNHIGEEEVDNVLRRICRMNKAESRSPPIDITLAKPNISQDLKAVNRPRVTKHLVASTEPNVNEDFVQVTESNIEKELVTVNIPNTAEGESFDGRAALEEPLSIRLCSEPEKCVEDCRLPKASANISSYGRTIAMTCGVNMVCCHPRNFTENGFTCKQFFALSEEEKGKTFVLMSDAAKVDLLKICKPVAVLGQILIGKAFPSDASKMVFYEAHQDLLGKYMGACSQLCEDIKRDTLAELEQLNIAVSELQFKPTSSVSTESEEWLRLRKASDALTDMESRLEVMQMSNLTIDDVITLKEAIAEEAIAENATLLWESVISRITANRTVSYQQLTRELESNVQQFRRTNLSSDAFKSLNSLRRAVRKGKGELLFSKVISPMELDDGKKAIARRALQNDDSTAELKSHVQAWKNELESLMHESKKHGGSSSTSSLDEDQTRADVFKNHVAEKIQALSRQVKSSHSETVDVRNPINRFRTAVEKLRTLEPLEILHGLLIIVSVASSMVPKYGAMVETVCDLASSLLGFSEASGPSLSDVINEQNAFIEEAFQRQDFLIAGLLDLQAVQMTQLFQQQNDTLYRKFKDQEEFIKGLFEGQRRQQIRQDLRGLHETLQTEKIFIETLLEEKKGLEANKVIAMFTQIDLTSSVDRLESFRIWFDDFCSEKSMETFSMRDNEIVGLCITYIYLYINTTNVRNFVLTKMLVLVGESELDSLAKPIAAVLNRMKESDVKFLAEKLAQTRSTSYGRVSCPIHFEGLERFRYGNSTTLADRENIRFYLDLLGVGNNQTRQWCMDNIKPEDVKWTEWGSWLGVKPPLGTFSTRQRTCMVPHHLRGGISQCPGKDKEVIQRTHIIPQALPFYAVSGAWGAWEYCPEGQWATRFELKIEKYRGGPGRHRGIKSVTDDTALNGVRLFCGITPGTTTGRNITSSVGIYGDWVPSLQQHCPQFLNGAQLRSEPSKQGASTRFCSLNYRSPDDFDDLIYPVGQLTYYRDETGANNLTLKCSDGSTHWVWHPQGVANQMLLPEGAWGPAVTCPPGSAICGLRTLVDSWATRRDEVVRGRACGEKAFKSPWWTVLLPDEYQYVYDFDDTTLNSVEFACCTIYA